MTEYIEQKQRDGKRISIWDGLEVPQEYSQSIKNLQDYIRSRPTTDIFLTPEKKCGVDKNWKQRSQRWNQQLSSKLGGGVKSPSSLACSGKQAQNRVECIRGRQNHV
jgi:hypothetical protein